MIRVTRLITTTSLLCLFSTSSIAAAIETTLSVKHMDCATCPVVVRAALYDLDGVEKVTVSMEEKSVVVKYDGDTLTEEDLAKAVTHAGFPAEVSR